MAEENTTVDIYCPKCGHKMAADMNFEHEVERRVKERLKAAERALYGR